MQHEYNEQCIYNAVRTGFANLKKLARMDVMKRWRAMDKSDRYAATRALVFMDGVAENPRLYFARVHTQNAWRFRAECFASQKQLDDIAEAYYIVEDPQGIVWNRARGAMRGELGQEFYRFCNAVQQWEYDRTSNRPVYRANAPKYAEEIVKKSKQYQTMVDINSANCLMRPIKQLLYQIQH